MSHRAGASTAIRWVATSSLVMLVCGRGAVAVQTLPDANGRLRSSPAAQMLTRYADGDDRSARTFAFQPNKAAAVRAFRDDVRDWIAEGGAQTNRSALAATFALDVVRQWAGTPDWAYAPALLAWGCGHVGAGSSAWSGERSGISRRWRWRRRPKTGRSSSGSTCPRASRCRSRATRLRTNGDRGICVTHGRDFPTSHG